MEERPLQCYKCLHRGHVRAQCKSEIDRTGNCYRCGARGHRARDCEAPEYCALCAEKGRPTARRIGGKSYPSSPKHMGMVTEEKSLAHRRDLRTPETNRTVEEIRNQARGEELDSTPLTQRRRDQEIGMQIEVVEVTELSRKKAMQIHCEIKTLHGAKSVTSLTTRL